MHPFRQARAPGWSLRAFLAMNRVGVGLVDGTQLGYGKNAMVK